MLHVDDNMATLLVRSKNAITSYLILLRMPERYKIHPKRSLNRMDPPWSTRVLIALGKLPGKEGTLADVIKAIEQIWRDMDNETASGRFYPKWHNSARLALRNNIMVETKRCSQGASRLRYKLKSVDARGVIEEYERMEREKIAQLTRAKRLRAKHSLNYVKAFRK